MSAHEAENSSTFTCDLVDHSTLVLSLTAEVALHTWTPLDVLVFIREGFAEPLPVGFLVSW